MPGIALASYVLGTMLSLRLLVAFHFLTLHLGLYWLALFHRLQQIPDTAPRIPLDVAGLNACVYCLGGLGISAWDKRCPLQVAAT